MKKMFNTVYPFTTEDISSYYSQIDFTDKRVLTLGSSSDQAYNAILLGASKITVYDINENIATFGKLKRNIILSSSRDQVYRRVRSINEIPLSKDVFGKKIIEGLNPYLQNDTNYQKLKERLRKNPGIIEYKTADIFDCELADDEEFDIIILSNVLEYLDLLLPTKEPYSELRNLFDNLNCHLKEDGILQLLYIYSISGKNFTRDITTSSTDSILNVESALYPHLMKVHMFENEPLNQTDAIVYYKK